MKKRGGTAFGPRRYGHVSRFGRWACSCVRPTILASFAGIGALSCAPERPASLPVTGIYTRGTSRLEVSRVVVNDPSRRERVHATYEQIVRRTEAFASWRKKSLDELSRLSQDAELNEAAITEQLEIFKTRQREEYQAYVELQLRLRALTTEEEFNQLGKFD